MKNRIVCLSAVILLAAAAPALAQRAGGPPPNPNELASALADLQNRVARLEGNLQPADLAGTYHLIGIGHTITAQRPGMPPIPATISMGAFRGAVTLNANGTGFTTPLECEASTLTQGTWTLAGQNCSEPADTLTWTYADGVVTLTFLSDGDEIPFNVGPGGRLLVQAFAPFHESDASSEQFLFIATRLK